MKYQELASIIKKNIDQGFYRESEKLPTEDNIMKEYKVTRYCVRNAVNLLAEQGLVYPVQGSGMFVRESKKDGCLSLQNTKGLAAEFPEKEVHTKVIRLDMISPDEELQKRLKCTPETSVYQIVRLRVVGERPFAVEYSYYNKDIVRYINREIAEGSLYGYLRREMGLSLGFADKIMYCEKLDEEAAELLQLAPGDPGMIVEDYAYLSNGQMFDASKVIYHYKYAKFFTLADMK